MTSSPSSDESTRPLMVRLWRYQAERFPLAQHGPLVAAFSACAVIFPTLLDGGTLPGWQAFAGAFIVCLIFFLQLRIADEFKDNDEDSEFRPYRAVPRGLIKLRELGALFAIGAVIQAAVAWYLAPALMIILGIAWLYLMLMSVEFFARDWLKARPITYLWTHMLIMPLVDLFATACYWIPANSHPGPPLVAFLAASFANGLVIEVGRKCRQPADEETGVPTYSKLWGANRASTVWIGCQIATMIFAVTAAAAAGSHWLVGGVLGVALAWSISRRHAFVSGVHGKTIETASGVWTLALYLSLGPLSWLIIR